MTKNNPSVTLVIIDGLGIAPLNFPGNVLNETNAPFWNSLITSYPVAALSSPFQGAGNLSEAEVLAKSYLELGLGGFREIGEESGEKTLGGILNENNISQLKVSETYGWSYLTYFLNGKKKFPFSLEHQVLVPSDSYCEGSPKLKLEEIYASWLENYKADAPFFSCIYLPLLGFKGFHFSYEEIVDSLKKADSYLNKVFKKVMEKDGVMLVLSLHGFLENLYSIQMEELRIIPTASPIPFLIAGKMYEGKNLGKGDAVSGDLSLLPVTGTLSDIAPTILKIFNLQADAKMAGKSLLS